jgi:hypothetical protein
MGTAFLTLAQGMRELCIPVGPFGITSLWQACSDYAKCNQDLYMIARLARLVAK